MDQALVDHDFNSHRNSVPLIHHTLCRLKPHIDKDSSKKGTGRFCSRVWYMHETLYAVMGGGSHRFSIPVTGRLFIST